LPSDKQSIGEVIALTHVPRRDLLGELIHEYRLVA
jgi:hypothetical protein